MKSNFNTINELAREVLERDERKKDLLPDTRQIRLLEDGETYSVEGQGEFKGTEHFHGQVAGHYGIPKRYLDACRDVPGLRAQNVNGWLDSKPEQRLVRTLDGNARAFMSKKYGLLYDDPFTLDCILEATSFRKDLEIINCVVSPYRTYLQFVLNEFTAEIKGRNKRKGDVLRWGATWYNSEVGKGKNHIAGWFEFCWCDNGCVRQDIFSKTHVGSALECDDTFNVLSNEAVKAEATALKLKLRDVLKHTITKTAFEAEVKKIEATLNDEIARPEDVVKNVTKTFDSTLTQDDNDSILKTLVDEGNLNRYGLLNAITALAHGTDDHEKQYEYEKLGGKIIELNKDQWSHLNKEVKEEAKSA